MRWATFYTLILLLTCVLSGAAFCEQGAPATVLTPGDPAGGLIAWDFHSAPLHDAQFLISQSSRSFPTSASAARRFTPKMMPCLQFSALQLLGVPPLGAKFRPSCARMAQPGRAVNPPLLI